ncbi:hypothetical protein SAMN05216325_1645 [Nitrosomonas marina]|uniref:Uncharacterized protein n=1 Tax=Nitrosomonas marina TaxID=917 RepID=A0A1H8JBK5_9PROT|nr:hypothetical protein SAMN05216325_1645 [Nitrosomonas marina]
MEAETIIAGALALARRREHLCRHASPCPNCGTNQVQLIDGLCNPALWRCRECRKGFEYEPESKMLVNNLNHN